MIKVVVSGGEGKPVRYKEFLISSSDDVSDLPTTSDKVSAGSIAYTQDLAHSYLLGPDMTWREV